MVFPTGLCSPSLIKTLVPSNFPDSVRRQPQDDAEHSWHEPEHGKNLWMVEGGG